MTKLNWVLCAYFCLVAAFVGGVVGNAIGYNTGAAARETLLLNEFCTPSCARGDTCGEYTCTQNGWQR